MCHRRLEENKRLNESKRYYIVSSPRGCGSLVHCLGGYTAATREDADVMVLDELSAKGEAARGSEDGKSIFCMSKFPSKILHSPATNHHADI
jgi:hypothetical protein